MTNINLLPSDSGPNPRLLAQVANIKKIGIILLVIAALGGLTAGGFLFTSLREAQNLSGEVDDIKSSIASLQASEQRLVLIRDRISKIKPVLADSTMHDVLVKFHDLILALPSDVTIEEEALSDEAVSVTFKTFSLSGFNSVLALFDTLAHYTAVYITQLTFSTAEGYKITMVLN